MASEQGTRVELEITNVAHGGISVARLDGRVVFVTDTLPGERVVARITDDEHASFWRADTVEVLEASPHRVPHVWNEASVDRDPNDRPGGAEFGHIELPWQRELKRQVIVDSLKRFAGIEREIEVEPVAGDDERNGLGWRTRVRLHVDADGRVGPFAARSHRVVTVDDLPLATPQLAAEAPLGERPDGSDFPADGFIDLVAPSAGAPRFLTSNETGEKPRGGRPAGRRGRSITEVVDGREFLLDEQGFWQVHHGAASTLSRAVQSEVNDELLDPSAFNLDLYGGVGLLAAALGGKAGAGLRITSVEGNDLATDYASENLSEWIGATAETNRVDRYLRQLEKNASASERERLARATVILDPPRAGAGKQVVNSLVALGVAQVLYVACDPVAFARDAGQFERGGYAVRSMRAFDLFPHTHHVESVALLTAN
ncbi:class I SAM-dependent RNA methyltransferase [Agreia sp. COWG]|uniref:class I SAM-dependent RNA methyltransferase n=1 Tax=Agreia sp. COWG TaxID=2773266 RepID=UPI0019251A0D|nr:TRAM domain-containing protein [Agreia sp. COWG]CAD5993007.1 23S rRNA methyltransferase [Agreia sp. COWG]